MFPNPSRYEFEKENIPPVSHPLIRLHPDRNNDRSLFLQLMLYQIGTQEHVYIKLVDVVSLLYTHRWKKVI